MFTNKKRESINEFVCGISLYIADTREATIKDHEPPLPLIPFGIVAYGLVGQPFLKQLIVCSRNARTHKKLFVRERLLRRL